MCVILRCTNLEIPLRTYANHLLNRPLTDRDIFVVQDYVRILGSDNGNRWFFTYNHDVDHPYFAPGTGFVRVKVKYQGMVGVKDDEGKTRLTWLVNMDLGGNIPFSFGTGLLVGLMTLPASIVENTIGNSATVRKTHEGVTQGSGGDKDAELLKANEELKAQNRQLQEENAALMETVSTLRRRLVKVDGGRDQ